jgi:predicted SnoaL-like aldol condensation-catalyzing enzyme
VKPVTERNKTKVRLFVEAVLNEGRLELIEELVAADFVGHLTGVPSPVVGRAEVRRLVSSGRRDYPDLNIKIDDEIAEDDRVVVRWRATATPVMTPSRRPARVARVAGVSIVRLLAGKQVDARTEWATIVADAIREPAGDLQGHSPG